MKKITAFLFCLMLVIASVAIQTDSIYAATRTVTYVMPDGGETYPVEAEEVAADAAVWGSGDSEGTKTWLYIAEDIDNSGKDIKVHGDVHLILGDNTTYRCSSLILDGADSNITFYSQSYGEGMGTFIADNADYSPAIGPNYEVNRRGGNITVNGGNIKATRKANSMAAVIGCDSGSGNNSVNMGTITINGGNVTVKSETTDQFCGSAIGTGWHGHLEKIVINGGNIDAESQCTAAAIGGSYESSSGIAGGAIELNGGNIKAYASGNNAAAFGGDSWTIVSQDNAPINSCYWYMVGGNNRLDRNNIDELGDNHYVEISRKENLKHSYSERFPVVQPEFDEGGTLVNAGCKAYFKCACGNYYVDCACTGSYDEWIADNYIGNTEEELNEWKSGNGRLEEKCSADYLCYENGEMKAKSQDSFYNLSYDGACVCGTKGKTTWYYINEDVEFGYNMEVRGDVRIILGDDVTADFTCGLNMYTANSSLTIYAQSEGDEMGRLIAGGCDNSGAACIGGNGTAGARIRIDGGNITAESDGTRVGIGDGNYPDSYPSVTINGGIIKARGHGGPAIGFDTADHAWNNKSCEVTINDGTVDAVSYNNSAAAIGSAGCYKTSVKINGGNITALGNGDGVAIGYSPVGWFECTLDIKHCLFDTVAGESAETAEKCDYSNQRYVKITQLKEPVHRLKKEYPMWAPRFNGDNTLAEAGCRDYYQCMCGYYYSDSELTKRISNLNTWKNDASVNGGKLDHAIHQSNEPTCSEGGYKEYYSKGKLYFSDEACTESIENLRAWKIKGGAGYLAPLKHDFTYTADGNVLTGTCTRDCCDLTDNKATLTIIGDEYAYDGKAKTPEIVNSGWDASIPEIYYEGTGETHYSGRTAPKDVGTYSASITVDGVTASTEFSISDHSYGKASYFWNDDLTECTAYHTCTTEGCGYTEFETVTPTEESGIMTATFTKAGFETQQKGKSEHKHSFSDKWSSNDARHWHAATCGCDDIVSGFEEHTWGTGEGANKCTVCGYVKPDDPTPVHVHSLDTVKGQAAACNADGWKDCYKCSDEECGKYFEDPKCATEIGDAAAYETWKTAGGRIAATGHNPIMIPQQDATAAKDGVKAYYVCKNCDACFEDAGCTIAITDIEAWKKDAGKIAKHSHSYGEAAYFWNDDLSECTAYHTCTTEGCGYTEFETVTPTEESGIMTATFTKAGFETQQKDKSEHKHSFSDKWSSNDARHWHAATCGCDDIVSGFEEHTWGTGEDADKCTVCEYVKQTDPEGHVHTFDTAWSKSSEYHWHAATCEHTDVTSGHAKHNYDAGTISKGIKTYTCKTCGYQKTEKLSVAVPKTSIKSVKRAKRAFTVKWTKESVTGYQIQYARNSKFTKSKKTVTVKSASTVSKKIKSLKKKKRYYVRVRCYINKYDTTYYSGWSSRKSVRTR